MGSIGRRKLKRSRKSYMCSNMTLEPTFVRKLFDSRLISSSRAFVGELLVTVKKEPMIASDGRISKKAN